MTITIKPLNPELGKGEVALVTDTHGARLANILISPGLGVRQGQLGGSCDCQEATHPCSHIVALQQIKGYEHTQDRKR